MFETMIVASAVGERSFEATLITTLRLSIGKQPLQEAIENKVILSFNELPRLNSKEIPG